MNLNATLLGQMITFALFVGFTMKFVWPPLSKALSERQKKIADGLAAAEQGQQRLMEAQEEVKAQLSEARNKAQEVIDGAHQRAAQLLEAARAEAREEGARLLTQAKGDIQQEVQRAKAALTQQVSLLVVKGAEQILQSSVDTKTHEKLLAGLAQELEGDAS